MNDIIGLTERGVPSFNGQELRVAAPAPFAWQAESGAISIKRADDPTMDCGSLRGDLLMVRRTPQAGASSGPTR